MATERKDTGAGEVVTIQIRGDTMLGIVVDPDKDGSAAVIRAWDRLPNGKFGPVQKHGGVHIGDVLFSINDISLVNMPFSEVKALLTDTNVINKSLKFSNSRDHYSKKRNLGIESALKAESMKVNFLSTIKQARVNETGKRFVEYEVACSFRVPASIQRDRIVKWSVWKRFSDFEALDASLRRTLGWQMDTVEFPSAHSLAFNKFSGSFIEQRRLDLNAYWQQVIVIDKVVDFAKHHCAAEVKAFLDVDAQIAASELGGGDSAEQAVADDGPSASDSKAPLARRGSVRRQSLQQTGSRRNVTKAPSSLSPTAEAAPAPVSPAAPSSQPPPPAAPRPPPPPTKVAAVAAPPPPAAASGPPESISTGKVPPKPTGARANLLGDIAKLRKG